ncbi:MAG: ATP synthase subunit I [Leptolyngbya sp. LCM1.Bin17]|uniref:N-ATPase subunit AtpR n=1 Tax=Nodosilinea sp. P-1105 TaxID=2546229 RepID=UPI0013FF99A5|nr:ATP synthase subunit I [Nodosilinea sp. P-1105]NMF85728.1 ATP synthase subunit I [Nodosilinea sp. P-1105]TVP65541.1 MAG: ATP synthase subunit I [Leptolyngbya sp. LCM1.Bin17]
MNLLIHTLLPDLFALPIGFGLGLFYFSFLWFTVQRLVSSPHPVLLMVGSGLARLSVVLLGFYLIVGGHWQRLLIALAGFLIARTLLIARWRPQAALGEVGGGTID